MDCDIKQKVCLRKNKSQLTELALECGLTEDEIDGKSIPQLCKLIIEKRGDVSEEYDCDVSSNDCTKNIDKSDLIKLAIKCGIKDVDDKSKAVLCDEINKAYKKRGKSSDDEDDEDDEDVAPKKKSVKKTTKKEEEEFNPKTISYSTLPKESGITLPKLRLIIDAQKFKISKSQNKGPLYSEVKKALKKKESEMDEESEDEKPKKKEAEEAVRKKAERKKLEKDAEEAAEAEAKAERKKLKKEAKEAAEAQRDLEEAAEAEAKAERKKLKKEAKEAAEAQRDLEEAAKAQRKKLEREAKASEDEKSKPPKKKTPSTPPHKKTASFVAPKMEMSVEDILKRGLRSLGIYSQIFEKYKIKNDDGKYVIEFKQIRQALKEKIGNKLQGGTMLTNYRKLIQDELDIMEEEEEEGIAEVINMDEEEKEDEEVRIRQEKEAEEERMRQEKEARIRQEKESEEERMRQEKESEEERMRQEKESEEERMRQEKEARMTQEKEERMRQEKEARMTQEKEARMRQEERMRQEKERIKVMLQKIGLEKFYNTFMDEGYDRLNVLLTITEEELKDYIGLNGDEIYAFMTEIARIKKQGKGRLYKFKTYKGTEDRYMWPPKDWTEDEILEEIQKVPGEFCDPENNINCSDDEVCNLSEDPPKCVSPRFASKIKEFKKLEEMEFKGKRIIGSESTIRILKQKLNIKEEGTPIVEPISKTKSFKEDEEIIEEDEVPPIPLEKKIEPKNIPEILKEIEVTKEEDINNIKIEEAQTLMISCLGLSS
jgi:hypothetical protein